MELNFYTSVKQPKVHRNVSVEWVIDEIKNGRLYKKEVELARRIGKGGVGYDDIKTSLPAVTWNFKFNGYKEDRSIIGSTGYIYYDIDVLGFDTSFLDKSKIFCFFSSLSNQGKAIIVKVSGITESNFNSTYEAIAQDLGISSYFDRNAFKKTQFTVLTYDQNAFVNNNSFIYTATEPTTTNHSAQEFKKVSLALNNKKGKGHIGANDTFFKYNNLNEYSNPNDVVVNEDGWNVVSLYLPTIIKEGKRKHTLLSYCNNLVLLNPDKTHEQIYFHLMERNIKRCSTPLKPGEIAGIVESIFRYKENGTLLPKEIKKRKIIFGKNCGMDKKDKMSFAANQVAEWKRNKTSEKIYDAIKNSKSKKITAKSVGKDAGVSIATVKRYWPQFKAYVKEKNKGG